MATTALNSDSSDDEDFTRNNSDSPKIILLVKGLTDSVNKSLLELLFESEKKSGGGEILKLEVDDIKKEAWIVFKCSEVAERVLKRGEIHFNNATLTIERHSQAPKWDGRTVYVTGITPNMNMTEDSLELIYESKRKSGGGPIESIIMDTEGNGALIKFESKEDAASVLDREIAYIEKDDSILYVAKPPITMNIVQNRKVRIDGFPLGTSQDTIELIYERNKLSGGGPVSAIIIEQDGSATITFDQEEDAENVLKKKRIKWDGHPLTASPARKVVVQDEQGFRQHEQQSLTKPTQQYNTTAESYHQGASPSLQKTYSHITKPFLQVSDIPPQSGDDFIKLMFESSKVGGSEIASILYNRQNGTAVIVYKDDRVTHTVMERHSRTPVCISSAEVTIEILPSSMIGGNTDNISSKAVEISGLPSDVTHDSICMLFENKKLAGGGDLDDCVLEADQGRAILTFQSHQTAKSVLEKSEMSGISLDTHSLTVRLLESKCKLFCESEDFEADIVCLKNVPISCQAKDVRKFLESIPKCKVGEVIFGLELGKALVKFYTYPGCGSLFQLLCQRPLKTSMLEMYAVHHSTSVQVFGVKDLTEQRLVMYFEHSRSSGGSVDNIKFVKEHDCAIVQFQDQKIARSVIDHPNHMFEEKRLAVTDLYYECIGVIPPNHDKTSQTYIPKDITISELDTIILDYILYKPVVQQRIEQQLEEMNAEISWNRHNASVTLKCTLQKDMDNFLNKSRNWCANVTTIFNAFMNGFSHEKVNVLQEGWAEFYGNMGSCIGDKFGDDVQLKADEDNSIMTVVGKKDCVYSAVRILQLEEKCITEKMEKRKTRIQETVTNLKPFQLKLLRANKFDEIMMKKYEEDELTVHIDVEKEKIVVTGLPNKIQELKVQIYEMVANSDSEKATFSPSVCCLLKDQDIKCIINGAISSSGSKVTWEVTGEDEVTFYATDKSDISKGISTIKRTVIERSVPLNESSKEALHSMKWIKFKEQLIEMYGNMVVINIQKDRAVDIAAHCDNIDVLCEQLTAFLNDNSLINRFYQMNKSKVKHIMEQMPDKIHKRSDGRAVATASLNDANPGFQVVGNPDEVSSTVTMLKELDSTIKQKDHKITRAGIAKYFKEERGQQFIEGLQSQHQVTIDIDPSSTRTTSAGSRPSYKKSMSQLNNGKSIHIVCGDITECQVDAIVNPANTDMKHGGGLAKAIIDKGGYEIDRQTRQYVQNHGNLLTGQACISDAGKLPCKKVIHTVGPIWKGGKKNEGNELYQAVYSSLYLASDLKFHSIALPAISAGKYAFPMEKACDIIVGATKDFLTNEITSIKDVHLVNNSAKVVDTFHRALSDTVGTQNVTMTTRSDNDSLFNNRTEAESSKPFDDEVKVFEPEMSYPFRAERLSDRRTPSENVYQRRGSSYECKEPYERLQFERTDAYHSMRTFRNTEETYPRSARRRHNNTVPHSRTVPSFTNLQQDEDNDSDSEHEDIFDLYTNDWKKGSKRYQVQTPEGLTVTLVKGDIAKQQADVIVNMTSRDMNLSGGGAVSKNILKTAGTGIQTECTQAAQGGVQYGDVLETSGGNMLCNSIYHGACSKKENLCKYFTNCLAKADTGGVSSVAFPSIGTGSMGIDGDYVANMMYDEVKKFSKNHPNTAIQEVMFVVYDDKTTRSFEQHADSLTSPSVRPKTTVFSRGSPTYWKRGGHKSELLSPEGVTVNVIRGSITHQQVDVIVNLTSRELDLNHGAVSAAISEAAGPGLQAECKQVAPNGIKYGGFVSTRGHNLPCQYVYHSACEKYGSTNAETHITQYMNQCLTTANLKGLQSIALPAIGTGSLGFPPKEVAKGMLQRIKHFSQNNPQASLQEINIVIYKSSMKEVFDRVFKKKSNPTSSSAAPKTSDRKLATVVRDMFSSGVQNIKTWWNKKTGVITIDFRLTSCDMHAIDQVILKLDQACEKEVADKVFDSASDQEFIQRLTEEQVNKIKQFEKSHEVSVTVERGQRLNRIRVQGAHADIGDVVSEIHKIFREVDQRDREEKQLEMIGKLAQWKYEDTDGLIMNYPKEINAVIEKAYVDNKSYVEWEEETSHRGTKKIKLDFISRREFDFDTREYRSVQRTSRDDVAPLPGNWSSVPDGTAYTVIPLSLSSVEYTDCRTLFDHSMNAHGATYSKIIKIQRIQNPSLYKKYQIHKAHMSESLPSGVRSERILWHGTSSNVVDEINANGFNRSMGKDQRQWYGKGAYFATYAGLSAKSYTQADSSGIKYLYRCKVLTGEYTKGNKDMIVPPPKNTYNKSVKFDSVVDDVNKPNEWVIFSDFAAYPEYLIQFK